VSAVVPRLVTDRYELRLANVSDVPGLLAYRRENADHFRPFEPVPAADHLTEAFWVRQVERDHDEFAAGLSVVRTSPDHGTAYSLAGKNQANEQSMRMAIYRAADIFKSRNEPPVDK